MKTINLCDEEINLAYFQAKIKMLLKTQNWSQTQFANYIGVSKNTASAWLNGNKKTQPRWLLPLFLMIQLFETIDGFNPMQLFYPDWKDKEIEKQKVQIIQKYKNKLNEKHKKYFKEQKELEEKYLAYDKALKNKCDECELQNLNDELLKKNKVLTSENNSLKLKISQTYTCPKPMTAEEEKRQHKLHPGWNNPNTRLDKSF